MDLLECAAEDAVLLFAGRVVETFHRFYDRSFRTPAAWIGVRVQPSRHDRVHFNCPGQTSNSTSTRPRTAAHARFLRRGRTT